MSYNLRCGETRCGLQEGKNPTVWRGAVYRTEQSTEPTGKNAPWDFFLASLLLYNAVSLLCRGFAPTELACIAARARYY